MDPAIIAALVSGGAGLLGGLGGGGGGGSSQNDRNYMREHIWPNAMFHLQPDQIMKVMRKFFPQIMAMYNTGAQSSIRGLKLSQSRRGIFESPLGLTQEAGMRASNQQAATQQAFQHAMDLAGKSASVFTGTPFISSRGDSGSPDYLGALAAGIGSGFNAYSLAKGQSYQAPNPYNVNVYGTSSGRSGYPSGRLF